MIKKIFVVFVMSIIPMCVSYAQESNIKIDYVDTIINNIEYYQKIWKDDRLKDLKYVEWYTRKDSNLICSYSLLFDKLFGLRNTYNDIGGLSETESFIYGLPIGTNKQYYNDGTIRAEGSYRFSAKGDYVDTVCIETSSGVGDINCSVDKYSFPKQGKWTYYSDNGKKQSYGYYDNNNKIGIWIFYNPSNGAIIEKRKYQ